METEIRGLPKNWIFDQFQECRDLTEEMKEKMAESQEYEEKIISPSNFFFASATVRE